MAPSRPRRTGIRRALPILALVVLALASSVTLVAPAPDVASAPLVTAPSPTTASPTGPTSPSPVESPGAHPTPTASSVGVVDPSAAPSHTIPVSTAAVVHPAPPTPPVLPGATRLALQTRLDGIRVKYGIPGVQVAIVYPDGTTWSGSSGLANVRGDRPVEFDTAFAVASVSKTFTAALILSLVEDGRVALDAPASRYVPALKLDRRITVRRLLDHTSGLHDFFFHRRIDRQLLARPARRWSTKQALRYMEKPYFKPGRGWHYSNTNYLVLGMIAEKVGGAPLAEQLRERFFDPLGLRHSYYQPGEDPRGPVAHGYRFRGTDPDARPIDLSDGSDIVPFTSVVTAAAGAGAIAANATDLARWARALYGGQVLDARSLRAMVDGADRTKRYRPRQPYGLGVQLVELGGRPTLGHSGRLLGFRSVMRWLPKQRMSIAVVTNQSRTDPGIIARALVRIALRPTPPCLCGNRR